MNGKEILTLLKERRSYRQFEDTQIRDEDLQMILEAGLYAPNAGSRQSSRFLVIQDKELNLQLGRVNRNSMPMRPGNHVNNAQPSIVDNQELKNGFYDAPTVITILAPSDNQYAQADCAISGQNMMLMAQTLGLGSCMIGRANETFSCSLGKKILKKNGFSEIEQPYLHIIIGYPKGETFCKDRKDNRIVFVKTK